MKTRKITGLVPLILPPPDSPRSEGIHVSNIIRCVATEMGILKAQWAEELSLSDARTITDPVAILRINMGLAWEKHYIPLLQDVEDHPGELELQGVYLTHDGESVSVIITSEGPTKVLVLHEVKCTYKSTKTVGDPPSEWMWLAQMKAYCKALNTRFARLHVLFVCGNYTYPIQPTREVWEIEFEQSEIDENWELLIDYRNERLKLEQ